MDGFLPGHPTLRLAAIVLAAVTLLGGFYLFLMGEKPPALTPVAQAAKRTSDAEGFRFQMTGSFSAGATGSIRMDGKGAYDGVNDRLQVQLGVSGAPGMPAGTSMTQVVDGSTAYISSPMFASMMPAGMTWMKIDMGDVLGEGVEADPRRQLSQLEGASSFTALGTQKVHGTRTTHYSAVIDSEKAGLGDQFGSIGIPTEVWIDSRGYVRRQTVRVTVPGAGTMDMTMSLSGFGKPTPIEVPPPTSVFDGSALLDQVEELSG